MIILASGYFNPLHVGHIEYLQKAKELGTYLIVIINNDNQVALKGSVPFMGVLDRCKIVKALRCVDETFVSIDQDETVCQSIAIIKTMRDVKIFAKGGDRNENNTPEKTLCDALKIKTIYGLGGKIRSSSEIKAAIEQRALISAAPGGWLKRVKQ